MGEAKNAATPGHGGPSSARFLLRTFKRLLAANNAVLTRLSEMDRALGGEYVFDKSFLNSAVTGVCELTHQAAYELNGMAGEAYVELYDSYLSVKDALDDILSGGLGPMAGRRALDFAEIGWEMEPLAGLAGVGLAVLGRRLGLPAPDGVAVTVTGMAALAHDPANDPANDPSDEAAAAITARIKTLLARLRGSPRLEVSLVCAGPEGAPDLGRVLDVASADSAEQAVWILRGHAQNARAGESLAAVVCDQIEGLARGSLQTLVFDPSLPPAMLAEVRAEGAGAGSTGDRVFIARAAPHELLRSRVAPKPLDARLPQGGVLTTGGSRSRRGSGVLTPDTAAQLAELGLAAERALGGPCKLGFVVTDRGDPWLVQVEPLTLRAPELDEQGFALPGEDEILLRGGQLACAGVAAGPVVQVHEDSNPAQVPLGAIGVAKAASPALARLIPRLGGLLAETGTAASHLGTVARENRVPAIFGLPGAFALSPGTMVTVDAVDTTVYRGVSQALLMQAAVSEAEAGREPEYLILRRLLRHIRPLTLIDPDDPGFTAENCRTCHDIIHFAHEQSVRILLSLDPRASVGLGEPRRYQQQAPFALDILDLGGALAGESGDVSANDVKSAPLASFLAGLTRAATLRQTPGRLSLGDIMAGLGRTSKIMSGQPGLAGLSLALAGEDYLNVTMRLGYHFSVVDALAGDRPDHNFIYFRYAGGFADQGRRERRARMIQAVLEKLDFKVTLKGDLVIGNRKILPREEALETLAFLGSLSAFTRQLDIELDDDDEAARLIGEFCEASGIGEAHGGCS